MDESMDRNEVLLTKLSNVAEECILTKSCIRISEIRKIRFTGLNSLTVEIHYETMLAIETKEKQFRSIIFSFLADSSILMFKSELAKCLAEQENSSKWKRQIKNKSINAGY